MYWHICNSDRLVALDPDRRTAFGVRAAWCALRARLRGLRRGGDRRGAEAGQAASLLRRGGEQWSSISWSSRQGKAGKAAKARFARVGAIVLAIHDASDVFLETGKMSKYSHCDWLANAAFLLFIVSWVALRLTYFPFWILRSTSYEVLLTVDKKKNKFDGPIYYYVFNSLLFSPLVLHIYWRVLIYRMLLRQIKTRNVGDDVRSAHHED